MVVGGGRCPVRVRYLLTQVGFFFFNFFRFFRQTKPKGLARIPSWKGTKKGGGDERFRRGATSDFVSLRESCEIGNSAMFRKDFV